MKILNFDYELLDSGNKRRLERFGDVLVERPAPVATWKPSCEIQEWNHKRLKFQKPFKGQGSWQEHDDSEKWLVDLDGIKMQLGMSTNGQIGIFPEQLENWSWIKSQLEKCTTTTRVLNIFAYTGIATLIASNANPHVEVCHVDGSKPAVEWAKKNAEISGMEGRPIRWIVDDAMAFLKREVRRGRKYDAFILDPPAFGRGRKGDWVLARDFPDLLTLVDDLVSDKPAFITLSCHAPELTTRNLVKMLSSVKAFQTKKIEDRDLIIPSQNGHELPSSICASVSR